jgi:hypothetical protein
MAMKKEQFAGLSLWHGDKKINEPIHLLRIWRESQNHINNTAHSAFIFAFVMVATAVHTLAHAQRTPRTTYDI